MVKQENIPGMEIDVNDTDMLTWKVVISGLDGTPYEVCTPQIAIFVRHHFYAKFLSLKRFI